jgi:thiol-disulfide isomerase/thioredoxin
VGEAALILALFVALHFWQTREMAAGAIPPVAGRLAGGGELALYDFLREAGGKPVLLYVWSTWCPICRAEEGTIAALSEDWPVLTLAMQSGDAATVAKFMGERGLRYPALVDTQGELAWRLGVRATPAYFVIDKTGAIRFSGAGYTTGWGLRARLWWAHAF